MDANLVASDATLSFTLFRAFGWRHATSTSEAEVSKNPNSLAHDEKERATDLYEKTPQRSRRQSHTCVLATLPSLQESLADDCSEHSSCVSSRMSRVSLFYFAFVPAIVSLTRDTVGLGQRGQHAQ